MSWAEVKKINGDMGTSLDERINYLGADVICIRQNTSFVVPFDTELCVRTIGAGGNGYKDNPYNGGGGGGGGYSKDYRKYNKNDVINFVFYSNGAVSAVCANKNLSMVSEKGEDGYSYCNPSNGYNCANGGKARGGNLLNVDGGKTGQDSVGCGGGGSKYYKTSGGNGGFSGGHGGGPVYSNNSTTYGSNGGNGGFCGGCGAGLYMYEGQWVPSAKGGRGGDGGVIGGDGGSGAYAELGAKPWPGGDGGNGGLVGGKGGQDGFYVGNTSNSYHYISINGSKSGEVTGTPLKIHGAFKMGGGGGGSWGEAFGGNSYTIDKSYAYGYPAGAMVSFGNCDINLY